MCHVSVCFVVAAYSLTAVSTASCFVWSHKLVLQIMFGQKTPRMRLKLWFMKVSSLLIMLVVVVQVSEPYSSMVLMLS